ncbi:MAG TPA: alpha/beta hydrolase [Candidatus Limnocylindrales bacterium]|nr:alpha/beta hydrolase [Candidatus Limnocylindrales bacterium]
MAHTPSGIAYDVAGPETGGVALVLVHAGIADRRMWDGIWPAVTASRRVLRVDLRGFGESTERPAAALDAGADLLEAVAVAGIGRAHLVGASMGAGAVVGAALTQPDIAASLVLAPPGGDLYERPTDELRAFWRAEGEALDRGDLDAAVEANLVTWVDGRGRSPDAVDAGARRRIGDMQRRAFEVTADWDDVEEATSDPPIIERLAEIRVPTLVLAGDLDIDAVDIAAARIARDVPGSRVVRWSGVAHVPSVERPAEFVELLADWMSEVEAR